MAKLESRAVYHTRRWWWFPWPRKLVYTPFLLMQWVIAACMFPHFMGNDSISTVKFKLNIAYCTPSKYQTPEKHHRSFETEV